MIEYIKNVRAEAKKVIFPEKNEVKNSTITTIAVCTAAALLLWGASELVIKLISLVVA